MSRNKRNIFFIMGVTIASAAIAALVEVTLFNKILRPDNFSFNLGRFVAVAAALSCVTLLIKYRHFFCQNLEKAFLFIALTLGIAAIIVFPKSAYVVQDDQIHFYNAYAFLQSGDIPWPDSFKIVVDVPSLSSIDGKSLSEISELESRLEFLHSSTEDKTVKINESADIYKRIVYLPFFIGFQISRFLHLGFVATIICAKICNFLCFVLLAYFAIKVSTKAKKIFFIFALLTSNLFFATQFSYDPMIVGSLMLGLALFFRILEMDRAEPRYLFGFVLATTWGCLPKAVYCPLLLLALFIPNKKFDCKKRAVLFKIMIVILTILIASTFILPLLSGGMAGDIRGGDTSVSGQISYIFSNPLRFGAGLGMFIFSSLPGHVLGQSTFTNLGGGAIFSYTKYVLPLIYIINLVFILRITFMNRLKKSIFTRKLKLGMATIYIVMILAIIASMYLSFTPIGSMGVNGVQARYFTPMLPLLLILLMPTTDRELKQKSNDGFALLAIPTLSLVCVLFTFILRVSII